MTRRARLRIGIDGHVLGKNIGGVERYVSKVVDLVPSLLPQYDFVIFVGARELSRIEVRRAPNVSLVALPVSDPLIQRSIVLPLAVRQHRIDVLQVQRIAPWGCGSCKIVLTVHDLIPIVHAADYPGFRNKLVRILTPSSVRRADFILCPTLTVCNEVATVYPGLRAPVRPFYLGADPSRFARSSPEAVRETLHRNALTRPFVYSPGAVEGRKNLETLVKALAQVDADRRPDLVLSGAIRDKGYFDRILALGADLGIAGSIRHLGFVAEAELAALYCAAAMCIAASRTEGFNLMPLEAMACGAIVLCSDIPVHRELYDGGVCFFPHDDVNGLARLIAQSLEPGRERGDEGGRAACLERLSWDAMGRRMASVFDDIAQTAAAPAVPHPKRHSGFVDHGAGTPR